MYIKEYLDAVGTSGMPIALTGETNGAKSYIKCASGTICCSYLNLSNVGASGGASFYAGLSSNDLSNNSGWDFASNCDLLTIDAKLPGCNGSPLDIKANHSPNITGFLWSGPNNFVANGEAISIVSLSNRQTGLYTLEAAGQIRKKIITQEIQPDTVLLFNNTYLTFRNIGINPINGNIINWYANGVLIDGVNAASYSPSINGDYYATFTSIAGCSYQTNTVSVTLGNTGPIYAPYNLTASLNANRKVNLAWNDVNAQRDAFTIYRSTNPTSGFVTIGSSSSLIYEDPTVLTPGTYYYKVVTVVSGVSSDYSNIANITLTILGVEYSIEQNQISIRPVPVQEELSVESSHGLLSQVVIYDQMGVVHLDQSVDETEVLVLNLNMLKAGMYVLKIHTTEGDYYKRFVKQ
jgi:hypothetical protein